MTEEVTWQDGEFRCPACGRTCTDIAGVADVLAAACDTPIVCPARAFMARRAQEFSSPPHRVRPPLRTTHTFVILEVSQPAFYEIAAKLRAADYGHAFSTDDEHGEIIDMHGIALAASAEVDTYPRRQPGNTFGNIAHGGFPAEPSIPVETIAGSAPVESPATFVSGTVAMSGTLENFGQTFSLRQFSKVGAATGPILTLASRWATFEQTCVKLKAQRVQRRDLRDAFYCGAEAFCSLMAAEAPVGDDDFADRLTGALVDELVEFRRTSELPDET